tara:strand:+ start:1120 stop:1719 length:600 start_codon:yes stop_codon:yes gene_type:complete
MGFDITGLNPKNIKVKNPKCPKDLFQGCSKEEEKKYFDDLGKYQEQKGTYFRNNVWWWRPLAHYVLEYTKVINEDKKKCWSYNDHCIVEDEEAAQIAKQLKYLIDSGHTKKFARDWEIRRKKIEKHNEKVEKELEKHTKQVRNKMRNSNLAPKDFPKADKKIWDKIYHKRNSDASYPFSIENVEEFAEFCEYSGGFSIG